jgi:hypothetical protein
MKIRTLTESQARRSWPRLIELQRHGYTYLIKRRNRVIARLDPIRPTIFSRAEPKKN